MDTTDDVEQAAKLIGRQGGKKGGSDGGDDHRRTLGIGAAYGADEAAEKIFETFPTPAAPLALPGPAPDPDVINITPTLTEKPQGHEDILPAVKDILVHLIAQETPPC